MFEFNKFPDIGIEVDLLVDFSILCETLERIGIVNKDKMEIYPSCYCIKNITPDGMKYRICHFKELFIVTGKKNNFTKIDALRLKTIVYFLEKWNIVNIIEKTVVENGIEKKISPIDSILKEKIDIVKFTEKSKYKVIHKFKTNQ